MAIFDEIHNYYPDRFPTPGLSEISLAEGAIALLLGAVTTAESLFSEDDQLSEDAIKKVSMAISSTRLFQGYSQDEVGAMFARVEDFYRRCGSVPVIEAATKVVPPRLRETVFALAAESLSADGFRLDSLTTLCKMAHALKIPQTTQNCVLEFLKIKNRS